MPSGKTVKLVLYELLQFSALSVTILVIMERFASLIHEVKGQDLTAYLLVVAASVAYVTSVTLLVWVPLKYQILRRRRFTKITQWRPTALVFVILCTLPCFGILIASSKVQVDTGIRFDHFAELPTSLVLFSLICVDIVERIRPFKLLEQTEGLDLEFDIPGLVVTQLEPVATISRQMDTNEAQKGQVEARNGSIPSSLQNSPTRSAPRAAYPYPYSSQSFRSQSGHLGSLWRRDARTEVFVDCFLFWFDTAELLRVAEDPSIFYSGWVFPIYIFAFLSTLRMIIVPYSPLLSPAGVALQDFPFFIIRIGLLVVFGYKTSVLYPLKNVLVTVTFLFFTFLTRTKMFRRQTIF